MSAAETILSLPKAFDPAAAEGVECKVQFSCSSAYNVVIKDGTCSASEGAASDPDLTLTIEDEDLVALLKGELNGMQAFMTGKLQVDGDMMLAQRLTTFFDQSKIG